MELRSGGRVTVRRVLRMGVREFRVLGGLFMFLCDICDLFALQRLRVRFAVLAIRARSSHQGVCTSQVQPFIWKSPSLGSPCHYFLNFWKTLCPCLSLLVVFLGKGENSWPDQKVSRPQAVCFSNNPNARISTFSNSTVKAANLCCRPAAMFFGYASVTPCYPFVTFPVSNICAFLFFSFIPFSLLGLIDTVPQCLKIQPNHWLSRKRNCRNSLSDSVAMNSWQWPLGPQQVLVAEAPSDRFPGERGSHHTCTCEVTVPASALSYHQMSPLSSWLSPSLPVGTSVSYSRTLEGPAF